MDPVTLVTMAVALGASARARDTVTSATKDAYAGLKKLLVGQNVDVSGVERKPYSTAQQDSLREDLTDAGYADYTLAKDVFVAAKNVVDLVAAHEPDAATEAGLDLDAIQEEFDRVRKTGERTGRITTGNLAGGIDVSEVRSGHPQSFWQDWAETSDSDVRRDTYTLNKAYLRREGGSESNPG